MRCPNTIAVIALQALGAFAAPERSAAEECGPLGVMNVDVSTLPPTVGVNDIRKCLEHPAAGASDILQKRECWHGKAVGCSHSGWCYMSCGEANSGKWCWLAKHEGSGGWRSCHSDNDCHEKGLGCGQGNHCSSCHCSCDNRPDPDPKHHGV
ncbi:Uncharacterized protein TPAR_00996 [Tolypocladium paradoxum]|uniref:IDI-2 n=1 Tax=Tolypocladium paradoxum TaxID=94208 RepID=A0A2S4L8V5_9HYPO|nr:Uncharacterized protein TPAR_00996 [Tolypocladium paradoxum]